MGENSQIEWTDHTFNPWRGCTKVSAGCANCYAETLSHRNPGTLGIWGPQGTRAICEGMATMLGKRSHVWRSKNFADAGFRSQH